MNNFGKARTRAGWPYVREPRSDRPAKPIGPLLNPPRVITSNSRTGFGRSAPPVRPQLTPEPPTIERFGIRNTPRVLLGTRQPRWTRKESTATAAPEFTDLAGRDVLSEVLAVLAEAQQRAGLLSGAISVRHEPEGASGVGRPDWLLQLEFNPDGRRLRSDGHVPREGGDPTSQSIS